MPSRARLPVLAVCGVLLLAGPGCGGGDDDSGGGSADATATATADTEVESTATSEPAATADTAADKDIAETGLLTLDDFPSGWTEEPDDDSVEKSPCKRDRASEAGDLGARHVRSVLR